jgi:hypothetical protein
VGKAIKLQAPRLTELGLTGVNNARAYQGSAFEFITRQFKAVFRKLGKDKSSSLLEKSISDNEKSFQRLF